MKESTDGSGREAQHAEEERLRACEAVLARGIPHDRSRRGWITYWLVCLASGALIVASGLAGWQVAAWIGLA